MNVNKTNINCEKPIYINTHSNRWKYWNFNIEIFTFFKRGEEMNSINTDIVNEIIEVVKKAYEESKNIKNKNIKNKELNDIVTDVDLLMEEKIVSLKKN